MKMDPGYFLKKSLEEGKYLIRTFLYRPSCLLCNTPLAFRDEKFLCRECRSRFRAYTGPCCRVCGKFLDGSNSLCGACAVSPPPFKWHRSFSAYENPLKTLIHLYKYRGVEPLKHILACFLIEVFIRQCPIEFDMILPVPPDPGRSREFHPVGELAAILAAKLSIPVHFSFLRKTRATPPQAGLGHRERRFNLSDTIEADDKNMWKNARILLVDDVYTTGTTICTCAGVMDKKGALVSALTLAQSVKGSEF